MSQQILQVNLDFSVPQSDLEAAWLEAAPSVAESAGLLWKVWLINKERNEAGGIYLFETREAAETYMAGPIVDALKGSPAVSNISAKLFDVMVEHSVITRGPVGNALAATSHALHV